MNHKKVVFIPAWQESPSDYLRRISKLTFNRSAKWKQISGVCDANSADYAVCLGGYNSILKAKALGIENSRIVYIKRESIESLPELESYHFGVAYQAPGCLNAAIHWIDLELGDILRMPYKKGKRLSAIVSSLKATPTHRQRLLFINELSHRMRLDVYGKGHSCGAFNGMYRGPLTAARSCKSQGLIDYEMSIAIENTSLNGYFTEKINDCFIMLTLPIYYGASDIEIYFPKQSMLRIEHLDQDSASDLKTILEEKVVDTECICAMEHARELVLTKYNLWNVVACLVDKLNG